MRLVVTLFQRLIVWCSWLVSDVSNLEQWVDWCNSNLNVILVVLIIRSHIIDHVIIFSEDVTNLPCIEIVELCSEDWDVAPIVCVSNV